MQALLRLSRIIDTFTEWVGRLAYILVPIVVAVGVWNVANRYVGRAIGVTLGSNFYIEAQWYIFSMIFLLGSAYALKHNEHVRVDVFYSNYPPKRKALVNLLGTLFFLLPFCGLLLYFGWPYVEQSWRIRENSPDPGGLPRYIIKTFILVSPILLIIQGISEAIKCFAAFLGVLDPSQVVVEEKETKL
ncbi:TRAP transporter small permease subunit [uncultured Chloroflexus sp.]|uniref:TRAP transporter small permease subunit n=1 Tax=uncultured Chloroflexus sp. TaxID=214040 RepID=UPI002636A35D|nr:TRAP transporter small permease subunit [uncultured Chloroflexus sp.]